MSIGLRRVAATGRDLETLTTPDERGLHRYPKVLPDGAGVIFTVGLGEAARLALLDLGTNDWTVLSDQGTAGRYLALGQLIYGQGSELRSRPFDPGQIEEAADPALVVREVYSFGGFNVPLVAHSDRGSLAYVPGHSERRMVWVDRQGETAPFEFPVGEVSMIMVPRLSPDGSSVAVSIGMRDSAGVDLLILDLARNTRTRVGSGGNAVFAVWSPGGDRVAFSTDQSGAWVPLWTRMTDLAAAEPFAFDASLTAQPISWSPDGQTVSLIVDDDGHWSTWFVSLDGSAATPFAEEVWNQWGGSFSPDGQWLTLMRQKLSRSRGRWQCG